ncbi:hypothetical protein [Phenylobacterium conjunctum]|uniref:Uncharacterized protein n=1 Tax=Phenylobacterium conjunctum TaxID=1298959 RepID=A0ABW3T0D7_9CAUL
MGLFFDIMPVLAGTLMEERDHWRQDAAARLSMAVAVASADRKRGDLDRASFVEVSVIMPTVAALRDALAGESHWPCCTGCNAPIREGHVVYYYDEGADYAHVDCGDVLLNGRAVPEEAQRWAEDPEFTPAGIAKTLADADAYLRGRD